MAGYRGLNRSKIASKASTRLKRDSKDALPPWYPILGAATLLVVIFSLIVSAGGSQEDDFADSTPPVDAPPPVFGNSSVETTTVPAGSDAPVVTVPADTVVSVAPPVETTVPEAPAPVSMVALPRLNGGTLDVPADAVVAALSWAEENGLDASAQPMAVLTGPTTVILSIAVDTGDTSESFNIAVALVDNTWVVR